MVFILINHSIIVIAFAKLHTGDKLICEIVKADQLTIHPMNMLQIQKIPLKTY